MWTRKGRGAVWQQRGREDCGPLGPDVPGFWLFPCASRFSQSFTFLLWKMGIPETPELDSRACEGVGAVPGSRGRFQLLVASVLRSSVS